MFDDERFFDGYLHHVLKKYHRFFRIIRDFILIIAFIMVFWFIGILMIAIFGYGN